MLPNIYNIWIILTREYIGRLKRPSFIIVTLLLPFIFAAYIGIVTFISLSTKEASSGQRIAVIDNTNILYSTLQKNKNISYVPISDEAEDILWNRLQKDEYAGLLVLNENNITDNETIYIYHAGNMSIALRSEIQQDIRQAIREEKLKQKNVGSDIRAIFTEKIPIDIQKINEEGQSEIDASVVGTIVGFIVGFIIFIQITSFGGFMMQRIISEKNSRVVEILISSITAKELMYGKILGGVCLSMTQLSIIIIEMIGVTMLIEPLTESFINTATTSNANFDAITNHINLIVQVLQFDLIIITCLFFCFGLLLYFSLFAAIGASVNEPSEAQQFTLPVTLLLIVSFIITSQAIGNPNTSLVYWTSLIPFSSPILMPLRLYSSINYVWWEVALSLGILITTTILLINISARIYRIGILSYGKKPSIKELWKWMKTT